MNQITDGIGNFLESVGHVAGALKFGNAHFGGKFGDGFFGGVGGGEAEVVIHPVKAGKARVAEMLDGKWSQAGGKAGREGVGNGEGKFARKGQDFVKRVGVFGGDIVCAGQIVEGCMDKRGDDVILVNELEEGVETEEGRRAVIEEEAGEGGFGGGAEDVSEAEDGQAQARMLGSEAVGKGFEFNEGAEGAAWFGVKCVSFGEVK